MCRRSASALSIARGHRPPHRGDGCQHSDPRDGGVGRRAQPELPPQLHIVTSTRRRAGYATVRPVCSRIFGRMQHKASRDVELLDALRRPEAADRYDWEALRLWLREGTGPLSAIGALRLALW